MSEELYTLRWRGRELGPFSVEEINRQLDDHEIGMGHEILYQDNWIGLEEFFAATRKPPPPAPKLVAAESVPAITGIPTSKLHTVRAPGPATSRIQVSVSATPAPQTKSGPPSYRMIFAGLAVLLGFSGIHNFYARQWLTGMLQLLLSVATYLMGFGIIASWLWAMGEALFVRRDGNGNEMI